MSDTVLLERAGGVATITLNRPDSMNSLSIEMKEALIAALAQVREDDTVRAVVLTGAGQAFCVGQDLREHAALLAAGDPGPLNTVREHYNPIALGLVDMPKPVVAAVNGMAAGAGASMAFACDFRVAAEHAAFLMAFARVGLSADTGASWTLPRLVGHARATALMMLAEPVTPAQALEMGLITAAVPDDRVLAAGHELASRLAAGPTMAYAAIKEAIRYGGSATLADALEREAQLQERCGATDDHRNATAAFVAKQQAGFEGR
ncbi:MAG: enoyl-CoA hydratase-related protein [Actinomycetota bacterium]|nr:enoyl-CoA hydratase-related protein [Actinomycetota bacterium]